MKHEAHVEAGAGTPPSLASAPFSIIWQTNSLSRTTKERPATEEHSCTRWSSLTRRRQQASNAAGSKRGDRRRHSAHFDSRSPASEVLDDVSSSGRSQDSRVQNLRTATRLLKRTVTSAASYKNLTRFL